jgi:hypothetical protein
VDGLGIEHTFSEGNEYNRETSTLTWTHPRVSPKSTIFTTPGHEMNSISMEMIQANNRNAEVLSGAVNHARPRPSRIPRVASQSYPRFHSKQVAALKIGIANLEEEIETSTGIAFMELTETWLTVHCEHSQSKLSQQELSDLQKATHFDKKELQQWYKGVYLSLHSRITKRSALME